MTQTAGGWRRYRHNPKRSDLSAQTPWIIIMVFFRSSSNVTWLLAHFLCPASPDVVVGMPHELILDTACALS